MIQILYIVSTLRRSGPTNQLYNLIKYLDRSQFEPHLITLSPEPQDSRWADFQRLGVDLNTFSLSRLKGMFLAKRLLKKKIKQIDSHIIHTQGIRADILLSKIGSSVPWFMTSRNCLFHDYPMKFGRLQGNIMAWQHLKAIRKCHNVIACSKTISRFLSGYGVTATAVQNGVELQAGSKAGAKLPESLQKPVFISVGGLIKRKNMHFLIQAFNEYANDDKGALVVLGDGPQMQELRDMSSNHVHFTGNVSNVADYLACSDYFVSSSFSEGLPNTVLEALAAGLPLLLSDIPSHLEIAEECQGMCSIFALKDGQSALTNQMSQDAALFPPIDRDEIRRRAKEVFSAQTMSARYQQAYLKAME